MKNIHEGRIGRTARFIANRLENETEVRLTNPTYYTDSRIWRIMCYMTHYCGKYWIEYLEGYVIIRKQE